MNMNEHTDNYTTERYVLGELPAAERDEFEEHIFNCAVCADDVRDTATVVAGVRAAVRQQNRFQRGRRNFTVPLAAAASVLVAVLAYQQIVVIPPLKRDLENERQPYIARSYTLRDVRAAQNVVVDGRAPFILDFDIPPDPPSPSYTSRIIDAHGSTRLSLPVILAAQARDPIHLSVPGGVLGAGDYTLTVTGTGGVPIVKLEFAVR
jgi:hypothetical protein